MKIKNSKTTVAYFWCALRNFSSTQQVLDFTYCATPGDGQDPRTLEYINALLLESKVGGNGPLLLCMVGQRQGPILLPSTLTHPEFESLVSWNYIIMFFKLRWLSVVWLMLFAGNHFEIGTNSYSIALFMVSCSTAVSVSFLICHSIYTLDLVLELSCLMLLKYHASCCQIVMEVTNFMFVLLVTRGGIVKQHLKTFIFVRK